MSTVLVNTAVIITVIIAVVIVLGLITMTSRVHRKEDTVAHVR